jgi:pantetheine-phosphate adenylyltransferase
MKTAIYPGTFDPVTSGHLDILREAARPIRPRPTVAVGVKPCKGAAVFLD